MTDQEVNEAVAFKLGWVKMEKLNPAAPDQYYRKGNFNATVGRLPDYVWDIKAAWEVVEHLSQNTDSYVQINICHGGIASVLIDSGKHVAGWSGTSKTDIAPMAICLAFLKLP